MNNLCYNCGELITKSTKEHIPAKAFFVGYSDEYLLNRITVPACETCNFEFSKIDNHLRDAIGIMNDIDNLQDTLTAKSVRSILRKPNWKDRIVTNSEGKVFAVKFGYHEIIDIQIKNFKGLFLYEFGYPISKDYNIVPIVEGSEQEAQLLVETDAIMSVLMRSAEWKKSGHEKIFRYIIKSLDREFVTDDSGFKLEQTKVFAAVMDYHEQLCCLVVATRV
jgi:hypothetical protein